MCGRHLCGQDMKQEGQFCAIGDHQLPSKRLAKSQIGTGAQPLACELEIKMPTLSFGHEFAGSLSNQNLRTSKHHTCECSAGPIAQHHPPTWPCATVTTRRRSLAQCGSIQYSRPTTAHQHLHQSIPPPSNNSNTYYPQTKLNDYTTYVSVQFLISYKG
jgi:hypothetical protein